ncbi:MAG: cadherin-like domain-containing protein, partial [Desulfuromonas sp.]
MLNAAIADQTFNGQGTFSYQIPANAFTDAEGLDLAYTVTLNGTALGSAFSGDYNAGDPSTWMLFDETSRTLTSRAGVDLAALMDSPLTVVVTATDSASATVDDTFTITLDPAASNPNPAAPNIAPTATDDHISLAASSTKVLALTDFGTFSDANGDSLASVKITSLPPQGILQYSADGTNWPNVINEQVISAVDITAGKLRYTAATDSTSFTFQVGDDNADGTLFSGDYNLTVDVGSATEAVTFDASTVSTAAANSWTSVYSDNDEVLTGYTGDVRVIVEATNGNVKLANAAGVTAITTGYGNLTDGSATSIAFEGTLAQVNTALQQLQANLAANPNMTLAISAIKGGSAYNPENGHYYEAVYSPGISWANAKGYAEFSDWNGETGFTPNTFNGLTGYLATITSAEENAFILSKLPADGWIGASDSETEGTWKWVTGPEAGTTFSTGNITPVTVTYANWNPNEPNDSAPGEDYGEFYATGEQEGKWNDLNGTSLNYYVVEYGGVGFGTPTEQASRTITLTKIPAAPVLSLAGDANYTENATAKELSPTILITDQDSSTLAWATVTISAGKVVGDSLSFTNDDVVTYGNIAAAYNADTGVMTLASDGATATIAQWQAALQAVTFASTSDDPGASRTIQWQVSDGTNLSNLATTSITVTEVNDAPTVTALEDVNAVAGEALNIDIGDIFTDPENDTITYSAKLADGSDLPDWLTFNAETHIFSGNPPAGTPYLDLKVIGTDNGSPNQAAFTTFRLNLAQPASGAAASNNSGTITISDDNGGSVALNDVLSASALLDEDGYTPANVVYQWQMRDKTGEATYGDWLDIDGATAQTFTVTQNESSSEVRVQAFYTDDGGFAEAPVSNALTVPALNVAGTVTITGAVTPGQTLVATLSDANGLTTATPTYTWYRGDTEGAKTTEIGGNFSSYTLTNADGGKYVTVEISYTDDEGTAETASDSSSQIQLGIVAPVAANDSGSATEAGGVDNATGGSNATGNLFENDTDANAGDTKALTALRAGSIEGLGTVGLLEGSEYVVSGDHGTLRVNKTTGAYTYTVNQWGWSVENLQSGQTLTDTFNYTVSDSTDLSDTGVLTITISGANDAPTVRDLPASVAVVEDTKTAIQFSVPFALEDIDSTGDFTVILTASEGKLTGATGGGVTVSGSESGTLTLVGSLSAINAWLNAADTLYYTSAPNDNGVAGATLTLTAADANGSGNVNLGTVNVDITAANDAPVLDLNADDSLADGVVEADALAAGADLGGNDHAVVFRPRGSAVNVVDSDSLISDIDGDTTLVGATAEITAGAWDNSFTIYETLTSTAGDSYVGDSGTITITGNGTGTGGLTGATKLTLSGEASHADYQAALETIQYNNSLDSAFAGNRTVTISVLDKAIGDGGLASNSASFTITATNAAIAVGQMIYIGGVDSGHTVAQVIDSTHFVASGPLSALVDGATLAFTLDGSNVTTATAKADLAATGYVVSSASTLVQVLWTPVVDLNGNATSGTDHATSYTEGNAGSYIATSNALVTDQDGNLASLTVLIDNPVDAAADTMFLSAAVVSNLTANGITTTFYDAANNSVANGANGVHKIVFSGDKDATYFQLGLRAVQYKNTSENPTVTPRTVTTTIVDAAGNDGVPATTTINIVPVNDAPVLATNSGDTVDEGEVVVIGSDNLASTDVDDDDASLRYVVTDAPDHGNLFRDSDGNGEVGSGETIALDGSFTQGDINAGVIKYAHDGSENFSDSFGFELRDGMEDGVTAPTGTFAFTVTPVNDAPVGLPTISGTLAPGEELTADVSGISDGDGPDPLVFSYQWKADGSDIAGATSSTYTLTTNESGKQITVAVTYEDTDANGGTDGTLTSAATAAVIFTNITPGGSVTIDDDGTPQAGEILTANTSAVTDADGLGPFSYQWQVSSDNGVTWDDVNAATARSYTL